MELLEEIKTAADDLTADEQLLPTALKLSLIRDIMKLTDKQLEYILNNLKGENGNAFTA